MKAVSKAAAKPAAKKSSATAVPGKGSGSGTSYAPPAKTKIGLTGRKK